MTTSPRATRPAADAPARQPRPSAARKRLAEGHSSAKPAGSKRAQVVVTVPSSAAPKSTATAPSAALSAVRPRVRAKVVEAEHGLVSGLVHSLQDLPTKLLARFGTASDLAAVLIKAQMPKPANKALVDQAAHFLRDLREAAQL